MSSTKYILGLFEDPDEMMNGIDKLQKNSIPIYDVYTPMPIHGIEKKLGLKNSRLGYAAFMFACLGGTKFSALHIIHWCVTGLWTLVVNLRSPSLILYPILLNGRFYLPHLA